MALTDQRPQPSLLGNTIEEKTRTILGWTADYTPTCTPPLITTGLPTAKSSPSRKERPGRKTRTANNGVSIATTPYPYGFLSRDTRQRKLSSSSSSSGESSILRQQLTPPPSPNSDCAFRMAKQTLSRKSSLSDSFGPLPVSPVSPNTPNPYITHGIETKASEQVFERLRRLVPNLPSDKNAYQVLVQTVSNVIDLEHQLQQLNEKTRGVRNMLHSQRNTIGHQQIPPQNCNPVLGGPANYPTSEVPDDLMGVDVSAFKCLVSSADQQPVSSGPSSVTAWCSSDLLQGLDPLTVDTTL